LPLLDDPLSHPQSLGTDVRLADENTVF